MSVSRSTLWRAALEIAALLVILFLLAVAPTVAADDDSDRAFWIPSGTPAKNFYGTFGFGPSNSNYPDANQDGSVSRVTKDENEVVFNFNVGYQINDYVAVQGGYVDLGEADFGGVSDGSGDSWEAGIVSANLDADAWELGIMGRWPINDRWYALGFIGQSWWESTETYVEPSFTTVEKESGSDITYALGFEFDAGLKDRIVYRFMGSHHEVDTSSYDVNTATAEVVYRVP